MNDDRVDAVLRELTDAVVPHDDVSRRIEQRVMRQIARPRRSRRALHAAVATIGVAAVATGALVLHGTSPRDASPAARAANLLLTPGVIVATRATEPSPGPVVDEWTSVDAYGIRRTRDVVTTVAPDGRQTPQVDAVLHMDQSTGRIIRLAQWTPPATLVVGTAEMSAPIGWSTAFAQAVRDGRMRDAGHDGYGNPLVRGDGALASPGGVSDPNPRCATITTVTLSATTDLPIAERVDIACPLAVRTSSHTERSLQTATLEPTPASRRLLQIGDHPIRRAFLVDRPPNGRRPLGIQTAKRAAAMNPVADAITSEVLGRVTATAARLAHLNLADTARGEAIDTTAGDVRQVLRRADLIPQATTPSTTRLILVVLHGNFTMVTARPPRGKSPPKGNTIVVVTDADGRTTHNWWCCSDDLQLTMLGEPTRFTIR